MADTQIQCVGIIMDGNRRWAKEKNLPSFEGHKKGAEVLSNISMSWARKFGIKHLVLYAFSTENWNRTQEEVDYLMDLFRTMMRDQFKKMVDAGISIRFVGQRERFPEDMQTEMNNLEAKTQNTDKVTVYVALSYGGRAEIAYAVNKLIGEGKTSLTEEDISGALWTSPMPNPDIIIRTGGDMRLSGFLTWQSIYSELFFTKTLWPDFTEKEFESIVEEFQTRKRRYGK